MKRRAAVVAGVVLVGLLAALGTPAIVRSFGPRVETGTIHVLPWVSWAPAGVFEAEVSVETDGGVLEFGQMRAPSGVLDASAVRRGSTYLAVGPSLTNETFVAAFREETGHIVAVAELHIEGPGPTLELLESGDDGDTFIHLATVPKPNYNAQLRKLEVRGNRIELELYLDDQAELLDAWWMPWHHLGARTLYRYEAMIPKGTHRLVSNDGGRHFTLR